MAPLVAKVFECWWRLFLHAVLQQCCSFGLRFYLQVGAWSGWRERRRNAGEQPPVSRFIYNGSLDDRGEKPVQWISCKECMQLQTRQNANLHWPWVCSVRCSRLYKHGFVALLDAPPVDDARFIDPASMLHSTAIDGFRGDAGICGPRGQSITAMFGRWEDKRSPSTGLLVFERARKNDFGFIRTSWI